MTDEKEANTILTAEYPGLEGEKSFDCANIPAPVRLHFLKLGVRNYIANRLNQHNVRHNKNPLVAAWAAYEAATAADPLQSAVPKPEAPAPVLNLTGLYAEAEADLIAGNFRAKGTGEGRKRELKDPLISTVTNIVVQEVYAMRKKADPKFTFFDARKEVGTDGIEYLKAAIDLKVEQGVDRTQLEKMMETKYITPAKLALGLVENKAIQNLPSLF
jgi:hypothetical protein